MIRLKKYSLHDLNGNYCHVTSNDLQFLINECNKYFKSAQVSEKYKGTSCWDGKIVDKFKTVYTNIKP